MQHARAQAIKLWIRYQCMRGLANNPPRPEAGRRARTRADLGPGIGGGVCTQLASSKPVYPLPLLPLTPLPPYPPSPPPPPLTPTTSRPRTLLYPTSHRPQTPPSPTPSPPNPYPPYPSAPRPALVARWACRLPPLTPTSPSCRLGTLGEAASR